MHMHNVALLEQTVKQQQRANNTDNIEALSVK